MSGTVDYFAYGSNLSRSRITRPDRAPSALSIAIGRLPGHTLRFHKRGRLDGTGKCNAFRTGAASDRVFGVIYRVTTTERDLLDRAEGEGDGYRRRWVRLSTDQGSAEAFTYVAERGHIDEALRPLPWYLALVIEGAREHGLPEWYVEGMIRSAAA